MEDWAEIRRLYRSEKLSQAAIARRLDYNARRGDGVDVVAELLFEHPPGRVIQCDLWFPAPRIAVGFGQEPMLAVLVMVAAFSRFIAAVMLPSRQTMDLVAGMRHCSRAASPRYRMSCVGTTKPGLDAAVG